MVKLRNKEDGAQEADGYYGNDEVGSDEFDLSFLDEDEPADDVAENIIEARGKRTFTVDAKGCDLLSDPTLREQIIQARRYYEDLDAEEVSALDEMMAEYATRGKADKLFFSLSRMEEDEQLYLWGEAIIGREAVLPGYTQVFDVGDKKPRLVPDTEQDVKGYTVLLTPRQLRRTEEWYGADHRELKGMLDKNQPVVFFTRKPVEVASEN